MPVNTSGQAKRFMVAEMKIIAISPV